MPTKPKPDPQGLVALLSEGLQFHQAGQVQEARRRYQRVLLKDPRQIDALHLLAVLFAQIGEAARGAELAERALKINPRSAEVWSLRGKCLSDLNRLGEALTSYDRAIALRPAFAEAHFNRAVALRRLGRGDEALAAYDAAIAIDRALVQAHFNRAVLLQEQHRPAEALAGFDRVIRLDPGLAEAHIWLGMTLGALGRHDQALACYDAALALKPDHAQAHLNRGASLFELGRFADAVEAFERSIALNSSLAEAHGNRGAALHDLHHLDEAAVSLQTALTIKPDYAEAHATLGVVLHDLGRQAEALASLDRAIALKPDFRKARNTRSAVLLLTGQLREGWREYEHRESLQVRKPFDPDGARRWTGQADIAGKTMFLHHEQGLGDSIQFFRYVRKLREAGADLSLSVQPALRTLFQLAEPGLHLVDDETNPPPFDYHCPLPSLPLAFGTDLNSIPAPDRYLVGDDARRARMEAMLGPRRAPRIGLVWSGNPNHKNDHNRSIAFEVLRPVLDARAQWICLHKEIRGADQSSFDTCAAVRFVGDDLKDFVDTAALVEAMDLVITVDTSVAHLAGALGKPVWILLPFRPDWRWLTDRSDSPWYPSARLFRRTRIGEWTDVIALLAHALGAELSSLDQSAQWRRSQVAAIANSHAQQPRGGEPPQGYAIRPANHSQ